MRQFKSLRKPQRSCSALRYAPHEKQKANSHTRTQVCSVQPLQTWSHGVTHPLVKLILKLKQKYFLVAWVHSGTLYHNKVKLLLLDKMTWNTLPFLCSLLVESCCMDLLELERLWLPELSPMKLELSFSLSMVIINSFCLNDSRWNFRRFKHLSLLKLSKS